MIRLRGLSVFPVRPAFSLDSVVALAQHPPCMLSGTTKREILVLLVLFVGAVAAYFWARNIQLPLMCGPDGAHEQDQQNQNLSLCRPTQHAGRMLRQR